MRTSFARRFAILVTTVVLSSSQAIAQSPPPVRLAGLIHDYTQPLDTSGPWLIVGEWSLTVNQASGKVGFVASLSMVRSENTSREAHTHHISLTEGEVAALANGYRITGSAVMTSNGRLVGFSGSPVDIEITGSSAVPFANVAVTFGGAAVSHFGTQPIEGVVTHQL